MASAKVEKSLPAKTAEPLPAKTADVEIDAKTPTPKTGGVWYVCYVPLCNKKIQATAILQEEPTQQSASQWLATFLGVKTADIRECTSEQCRGNMLSYTHLECKVPISQSRLEDELGLEFESGTPCACELKNGLIREFYIINAPQGTKRAEIIKALHGMVV